MTTRRLLLYFPKSETEKPIVYHLVKEYDLLVNIFRAKVTPDEYGYLVLDITGADGDIARGLQFIETFNVRVSDEDHGLYWDRERCVSCGNCIPHCPTTALSIVDEKRRTVGYNAAECIDCLSCISNCPFGACSSIFSDART